MGRGGTQKIRGGPGRAHPLRRQHNALGLRAEGRLPREAQAGPKACEAQKSRLTFREFLATVRNPWARQSFQIANRPGYVDRLLGIYKTEEGKERPLDGEQWREISRAYDARDDVALLEALFRLETFPVKGIEASLLRTSAGGHLLDNPKAVRKVARRIYALGKEELRARCEAPVASSRQLGQAFREWLRKTFEAKDEDEFLEHSRGVCVLAGSDQSLERFACEHLGYGGDKGLDGIIKVNTTYLPLEAKLLSAFVRAYGRHRPGRGQRVPRGRRGRGRRRRRAVPVERDRRRRLRAHHRACPRVRHGDPRRLTVS